MSRESNPDTLRIRQDRRLVQRLLSGDEAAFDAFAEDHFPVLYRFALSRLGHDEGLAQDVVQETLCTAIDRLEAFRGESTLLTWLCGICHFQIQAHFRRQKRRGQQVELDEQAPRQREVFSQVSQDGPLGNLERKEVRGMVFYVLDQLPEHYGQVLEWKYLEGLAVKDIAQRLSLGPKAAESMLTRARDAFRRVFEKSVSELQEDGFHGLRFSTQEGNP